MRNFEVFFGRFLASMGNPDSVDVGSLSGFLEEGAEPFTSVSLILTIFKRN